MIPISIRKLGLPRLNADGNLLHPNVARILDSMEYDATPPMNIKDLYQP